MKSLEVKEVQKSKALKSKYFLVGMNKTNDFSMALANKTEGAIVPYLLIFQGIQSDHCWDTSGENRSESTLMHKLEVENTIFKVNK